MEMEVFAAVQGSMTSNDGAAFLLRVRKPGGGEVMLEFPHSQISNIVENAAMQLPHGKANGGEKVMSAFKTSGFQIDKGPRGECVLSMEVGKGGKISFLLPDMMPYELTLAFAKLNITASKELH